MAIFSQIPYFTKAKEHYDRVSWFFRMQMFSYLGMGFQLLRIDATVKFWTSIYFVGHAILPVLYAAGWLVVKPLLRGGRKESEKDK